MKNMVVEYVEETTASPIDGLKNDIVHNDEVTGYFDKYMATELVSDENKDDTYYA